MDKLIIFIIFMIFNSLFALSAVSVLGSGVYLIIKLEFNQYLIILLITGLIMTSVSVMGKIT